MRTAPRPPTLSPTCCPRCGNLSVEWDQDGDGSWARWCYLCNRLVETLEAVTQRLGCGR